MRSQNVIKIELPALHNAQLSVKEQAARFNVLACGRRFGKTTFGQDRLLPPALAGAPVAWFAPTYKMLAEVWREITHICTPIIARVQSQEKRIELATGGVIDMWSLDSPDKVRGRKYKTAVVDEAAMVRDLGMAWNKVIRPTLVDLSGDAWLLSTPRGRGFFYDAFNWGQDPGLVDWMSWQMPTSANPHIPVDEIDEMRRRLPEIVFEQEILAKFLDEAGGVFRNVRQAIDTGRTVNEQQQPGRNYVVGLDLARVEDFTVITVFDSTLRQVYFERFNQISWERQTETVIRVSKQFGFCPVVMDSTGLGDPIYETLRRRNVNVRPFHFTNSSKESLIDNLAMLIENARCRLMDIDEQTQELMSYQYEITASRNIRMNAPDGCHDDCVISLALAAWGASNTKSSAGAVGPDAGINQKLSGLRLPVAARSWV